MSIHPDLEWLASHVSEWPIGYASCDVVEDESVLPHGRRVEYKKEGGQWSFFDWQLARDAWLESARTPEEEQDYAPEPDMVNEPPHYKQGGIECIDAIRAALTPEEFRGFCKGNALKYVWRELHKGGNESMRKASWYINKATEASALRAGELGD